MSSFKVFTTVTCRCGKEMESREIFQDGEWRCACGESVNIPTHTTLQNERDEARAREERWKRAVAKYYNEVGIPCQLPNDIFRLLPWPICKAYNGTAHAMRDGNLEALETVLKIHGGKKE